MEIKFFEYSEPLFDDEESRDLDRKTISSSGISGSHFMGFAALSIYQKYRKNSFLTILFKSSAETVTTEETGSRSHSS
ncbi:hypothetical protein LEP1GSC043_3851 [Leptospira weilii str. Ecochallenge]|uniref:GHKL domain protein n=1 Tax=Leptospira weilii str. Ecochallenge TaxID=1049986 RepID=N1U2Z3_9LEPT|nr:hypothetical protein LEP1GSC043_3851 [Leptospira weilii str. Ecochallenge]